MKRFRVRAATKTYEDHGPDLLRPAANAVHVFADNMGKKGSGFFTRRNPPGDKTDWTEWIGPQRRGEVLQKLDKLVDNAATGTKFQTGLLANGKPKAKVELLVETVKEVNLSGVNEGAELVADLARAQFGTKVTVLGFSCREYNGVPGSGWSDHAWGDAVDIVPDAASMNDELTDWCVRMAREGCMVAVQQFIGSIKGRVYSFASPSYAANLGGPSSHEWHVHCSYRQHYGTNPHCS